MQCLPPVQHWENKADSQSKKATTLLGDGFFWRSRRDSLAVLPHRDTESGETLPVAEKVSRFRGSGTIDGTGQVASIVMHDGVGGY